MSNNSRVLDYLISAYLYILYIQGLEKSKLIAICLTIKFFKVFFFFEPMPCNLKDQLVTATSIVFGKSLPILQVMEICSKDKFMNAGHIVTTEVQIKRPSP